ncbi:MAG: type II toxin-antitoxin system YafQ family toxin [Ignavibacteriae bacterium]|nr:type II toxin-antitoxin system YafQ family toxin [Ignavibacteriota bacterium]
MYKIVFTESYDKRARRFLKQHPDLRKQYEKTLELLESNPFHPSLKLHPLKGRLRELHSVYINLVYRIVIEFIIQDDKIIPIDIGSHDEEY